MEPSSGPLPDFAAPGSRQRSGAESLLGVLVDGRYCVDRVVGAGGFGVVYAARHIGLGATVALKALDLKPELDPQRLAARVGAFLEEARTLRRLRHPNIVAALDVGFLPPDPSGQTLPYLVMEWCPGATLRAFLDARRGAPMSIEAAWALFSGLVDAVTHAHRAGIVHRDIKPENVLLDAREDGAPVPRVIDFGLAKMVAPEEAPGTGATRTASDVRAFTPRYAAPEQLLGGRTGPWTDVHALGLVFVEILTGRPAFDSAEEMDFGRVDPERPTPKRRGIDVGAIEPVLARALALRPSDRFPDAAAFGRAMREALDGATSDDSRAKTAGRAPREGSAAAPAFEPTVRDGTSESLVRKGAPDIVADTSRAASTTSPLVTAASVRPAAQRPPRSGRAATWILAVALSLTALIVFSAWTKGPFSDARLRDVPVAEIERRLTDAGFKGCRAFGAEGVGHMQHQISCERGAVFVLPKALRVGLSPEEAMARAKELASTLAGDGPARVAVDGDYLLLAIGGPSRGKAIFEAALGEARVDFVDAYGDDALGAEPGSAGSLAAWTPSDLLAAVHATGEPVLAAYPNGTFPYIVVSKGPESATVFLVAHAPETLAAMKRGTQRIAYATDGDLLLGIMGTPGYANLDLLKRILGETRATTLGVHPSP